MLLKHSYLVGGDQPWSMLECLLSFQILRGWLPSCLLCRNLFSRVRNERMSPGAKGLVGVVVRFLFHCRKGKLAKQSCKKVVSYFGMWSVHTNSVTFVLTIFQSCVIPFLVHLNPVVPYRSTHHVICRTPVIITFQPTQGLVHQRIGA